jgi:hypothetical protein
MKDQPIEQKALTSAVEHYFPHLITKTSKSPAKKQAGPSVLKIRKGA